jgi:hypothetical protein
VGVYRSQGAKCSNPMFACGVGVLVQASLVVAGGRAAMTKG